MNKLEQSYIINKDSQHQYILAQIDHLDRQNKKLVSIADNILKTSFLRPSDQKPAIIMQFQEDMRTSFKALIDSIREFFINIDQKMERLGSIVQAKFQESDLQKSKPHPRRCNNQPDKLESLMERMTLLEHNLKKTQENESKLISIIQAMTNKRTLNDEEPTMVRSRDKHFNFQKEEPRQGKSHETSFRLFSMQDMHGLNSTEPDSYNLPYNMVTSQVSEHKNLDRQETFKFNNFCMPIKEESRHAIGENFLANRRSFETENSNRIHRLSTLMKALKE